MAYQSNVVIDGKWIWFRVEIDEAVILEMVKKAVQSKGQKSKDGPVTVKITKVHKQ